MFTHSEGDSLGGCPWPLTERARAGDEVLALLVMGYPLNPDGSMPACLQERLGRLRQLMRTNAQWQHIILIGSAYDDLQRRAEVALMQERASQGRASLGHRVSVQASERERILNMQRALRFLRDAYGNHPDARFSIHVLTHGWDMAYVLKYGCRGWGAASGRFRFYQQAVPGPRPTDPWLSAPLTLREICQEMCLAAARIFRKRKSEPGHGRQS